MRCRWGLAVLGCALLMVWWNGGARGEPTTTPEPARVESRSQDTAAPLGDATGATFPYRAAISAEPASIRSGPGEEYYETGRLRLGDEVEVYRHDAGGWCAIRPPPGSFSYVPGEFLKPLDDSLAETTVAGVKSLVGSSVGAHRNRSHVSLRRGEQVELLEKPPAEGLCRIAPPAGEFRWLHESCLERLGQLERGGSVSNVDQRTAMNRGDATPASRAEKWRAAPRTTALRTDDANPADGGPAPAPRGGGPDQWVAASRSSASDVAADSNPPPGPQPPRRPMVPRRGWIRPSSSATDEVGQDPVTESVPTPPAAQPQNVEGPASGGNERGDGLIGAALDELDVELAKVVCQPKDRWALDAVRDAAKEVLRHAEAPADRGRARQLLERIAQFEEVRRQALGLPTTIIDERSLATSTAEHRMVHRSSSPSSAASAAGRASSKPAAETSAAAPLPPNWEDPRFDGSGRLVPLEKRGDGDPQFLLVDDQGVARYFVTAAPGVNLRGYRDRLVGITGSRVVDPARGKPHLTAHRVTVLGDAPRRR